MARWLLTLTGMIVLFACLIGADSFAGFYRWAFPELQQVVYPQGQWLAMFGEHCVMVGGALAVTLVIAVVAAWAAQDQRYRMWILRAAEVTQICPPIVVLAIVSTWLGYGPTPTVAALVAYGILPVVSGFIKGIEQLPEDVVRAGEALGFRPGQVFWRIKLPLAVPVAGAGLRLATVSHIGTATIGATMGAGGLGKPIVTGLAMGNTAYLVHGSLCVGLMAVICDAVVAGLVDRR